MKRKNYISKNNFQFSNKIFLENTMEASQIGTPKKIYINFDFLESTVSAMLKHTNRAGNQATTSHAAEEMMDCGVPNSGDSYKKDRDTVHTIFIRGSIHEDNPLKMDQFLEIEHDMSESKKDFYKALEELLRYTLYIELEHNAKRIVSIIKGGRIKVPFLNYVPNWSLSDLYV